MENSFIFGIDMGGTHTRIAIMSAFDKSILMTKKCKTRDIFENYKDPIIALSDFIKTYLSGYHKVIRVVIAFPAIMNTQRTHILSCPNIAILNQEKRNIVSALSMSLGANIFIERDVHMQLYFDINHYKITDNIVIGFYIGTGFGQGIWINELFIGQHGVAGEVGHIPTSSQKIKCGCGLTYCLESICSGKWLYKWHQEQNISAPLDDIWIKYNNYIELQNFIDMIARIVATNVNILDPGSIILGGGIIDMKNFPKKELKNKCFQYIRKPIPADELQVFYAPSSDSNGAIGACLYGYNKNKGNEQCLKKRI